MEFGQHRYDSPRGAQIVPFLGSAEVVHQRIFPRDLNALFAAAIESGEYKSRKILSAQQLEKYLDWHAHPKYPSTSTTAVERRLEACEKYHCINAFRVSKGHLYRATAYDKGRDVMRYAVSVLDAAEIMAKMHTKLMHASKFNLKLVSLHANIYRGRQDIPPSCDLLLYFL
jgi:hypothetical protein